MVNRTTAIILTALLSVSCAPTSPPGSTSSVSGRALNSWSAQLEVTPATGAARLELRRDGRPIDAFPFPGGGSISYTDALLWPSSQYSYEVRAYDRNDHLIDSQDVQVVTPAQHGSFPRLYASSSFWNQPIAATAALDPGSAAMVAKALVPYQAAANFWAGSNTYARPLAYANPASPLYAVGCSKYDCQTAVSFRIPLYATPSTGADHHLVVINAITGQELDLWLASHDPDSGTWTAGGRYLTDPSGRGSICAAPQHCQGAVASGFAAFGGIIRPEEIAQGHIDHALFFTTPYTRAGFIACPATHTDGQQNDPAAIPEGGRIQLDPAFNVDAQSWPRWEKVLAHALQTYGAYLGDTGGSVSFFAEAPLDRGYDAWSLVGVPAFASLSNLPWDHFRVLTLHRC